MSKDCNTGLYICDACGKLHTRRAGNNIYKIDQRRDKFKTMHFCSYTCYMKIKRLIEARKYDEIQQIIAEHQSLKMEDS